MIKYMYIFTSLLLLLYFQSVISTADFVKAVDYATQSVPAEENMQESNGEDAEITQPALVVLPTWVTGLVSPVIFAIHSGYYAIQPKPPKGY
jgi:hypothetical protein